MSSLRPISDQIKEKQKKFALISVLDAFLIDLIGSSWSSSRDLVRTSLTDCGHLYSQEAEIGHTALYNPTIRHSDGVLL